MIAYLRLIANSDDDPAFIRAVTTPKRGIGAATLEKLGQVAATLHVSLFEAVFSAAAAAQIGERQLAPLIEFCNFINRIEERVAREPAGEVLNDLLKSIDYEVYMFDQDDTRVAQSKWNNVLEFVAWIAKKGEEDDKNLLQTDADHRADHPAGRPRGRRARRRAPVHPARRQGPGVRPRVPGRHRGKHPAAPRCGR